MLDLQGLLLCLVAMVPVGWGEARCPQGQAALYKLTFQGLWSPMLFPKHYPKYRPHAQWSKIIALTHGPEEVLWRLGEPLSPEFREFVESRRTTRLDARTQGQGQVYDIFNMPKINKGVGQQQSTFVADSDHPHVSLAAKLIPSPDWFVGLDSLSLCEGGEWLENKVLPLKPLDGGVQRGVMYSSPKWPEAEQKGVSEILHKPPAHTASSFYYPKKRRLPTIAKVVLVREKVYDGRSEGGRRAKAGRRVRPRERRVEYKPVIITPEPEVAPLPSTKDCVLSSWSAWTTCSKTCGFGRSARRRIILEQPQLGGAPCQKLIEVKTCGSMKQCQWSYFSNKRWRNSKPLAQSRTQTGSHYTRRRTRRGKKAGPAK